AAMFPAVIREGSLFREAFLKKFAEGNDGSQEAYRNAAFHAVASVEWDMWNALWARFDTNAETMSDEDLAAMSLPDLVARASEYFSNELPPDLAAALDEKVRVELRAE